MIGLKNENLMHLDIILTAPKFGFSMRRISGNNILYLRPRGPLDSSYETL